MELDDYIPLHPLPPIRPQLDDKGQIKALRHDIDQLALSTHLNFFVRFPLILPANFYTETEVDALIASMVEGPATNTDNYIPQWDGANSLLLKDGLAVATTVGDPGSDSSLVTEQGVRESLDLYYTISQLDAGQLDNRYYTETELDAGQLDDRYYTETESDARFADQSHAGTHIDSGSDIMDGDLLWMTYLPTVYTRATAGLAPNPEDLTAHLRGINDKLTNIDIGDDTNLAVSAPVVLTGDTLSLDLVTTVGDPGSDAKVASEQGIREALNAKATTSHAATHIASGSDEIDGDKLDIDWNPSIYTPATTPGEADSVDNLTAHLYGIDQKLTNIDISDDTNLGASGPLVLTGDTLSLDIQTTVGDPGSDEEVCSEQAIREMADTLLVASAAHLRAHDVDDSNDHNASGAGDKGKFVKANVTTGAVEWAAAPGHGSSADLSDHTDVHADVSGSDVRGDIFIRGATSWTRLAKGAANTVLKHNNTDPSWATLITLLSTITGYDGGKTQVLSHVSGTLTWQDTDTCA